MTSEDAVRLPAGPGVTLRWTAAIPLMIIGLAAPILAVSVVQAWGDRLDSEAMSRSIGLGTQPRPFGAAFGSALETIAFAEAYPLLLGVVALVVNRRAVTRWPAICLWTTVPAVVPFAVGALVFGLLGSDDRLRLLGVPAAVAAAALGWASARLAAAAMTRPCARDLVESGLEVPLRLAGGVRLHLQHDRLLLRLGGERTGGALSPRRTPVFQRAMDWPDLTLVKLGSVGTAETSRTTGYPVPVPPGPALRVVGTGQQWLLPISGDPDPLVEAVLGRADHAARRSAHPAGRATPGGARRARGDVRTVTSFHMAAGQAGIGGAPGVLVVAVACLTMAVLSVGGLLPPVAHAFAMHGLGDRVMIAIGGGAVWGTVGFVAARRYRRYAAGRRYLLAHPWDDGPPPAINPAVPPAPSWTVRTPAVR